MNVTGGNEFKSLDSIFDFLESNNDDQLKNLEIFSDNTFATFEYDEQSTILMLDNDNLENLSSPLVICNRDEYIAKNREKLGKDPNNKIAEMIENRELHLLLESKNKSPNNGKPNFYGSSEVVEKIGNRSIIAKKREGINGSSTEKIYHPGEFVIVKLTPEQYAKITGVVLRCLGNLSETLKNNQKKFDKELESGNSILKGRVQLWNHTIGNFIKDFLKNLCNLRLKDDRRKEKKMIEIKADEQARVKHDRIKENRAERDKNYDLIVQKQKFEDISKDQIKMDQTKKDEKQDSL